MMAGQLVRLEMLTPRGSKPAMVAQEPLQLVLRGNVTFQSLRKAGRKVAVLACQHLALVRVPDVCVERVPPRGGVIALGAGEYAGLVNGSLMPPQVGSPCSAEVTFITD